MNHRIIFSIDQQIGQKPTKISSVNTKQQSIWTKVLSESDVYFCAPPELAQLRVSARRAAQFIANGHRHFGLQSEILLGGLSNTLLGRTFFFRLALMVLDFGRIPVINLT